MTAPSTTFRRLWSFWIDGIYLTEPPGSEYASKGMTKEQMRKLQELNTRTPL